MGVIRIQKGNQNYSQKNKTQINDDRFLGLHVINGAVTIEHRCEDGGSITVSASCVTISNPDSLSSSETGVNPGIRS
jgi:hypothetical protein